MNIITDSKFFNGKGIHEVKRIQNVHQYSRAAGGLRLIHAERYVYRLMVISTMFGYTPKWPIQLFC